MTPEDILEVCMPALGLSKSPKVGSFMIQKMYGAIA
jgi:hypothetical protein